MTPVEERKRRVPGESQRHRQIRYGVQLVDADSFVARKTFLNVRRQWLIAVDLYVYVKKKIVIIKKFINVFCFGLKSKTQNRCKDIMV